MLARWKKWSATLTAPFLGALLLAGGFWAFLIWDQSYWWRVKEDYSFGWLVPVFVVFVIYDRWGKIGVAVAACAAPGSPRATGMAKWLLRVVVGATLLGGLAAFLLGVLIRSGEGVSQPATVAMAVGTAAIVLALLFLNAPVPTEGSAGGAAKVGFFGDARWRLVALFVFPALVWLVSAPMIAALEVRVSTFLLGKVVTVVSFVFDVLGLPLEQHGNVLVLPNGSSVGVEEACSGIRSLTGCLFAGSFLAAVFLDRFWKKVALVVAAMVLAFLTNLLRGLFLTTWAYKYGSQAMEGTVHDAAGYSVMVLTVIGLLCLLPLFNLSFGSGGDDDEAPEELKGPSGAERS